MTRGKRNTGNSNKTPLNSIVKTGVISKGNNGGHSNASKQTPQDSKNNTPGSNAAALGVKGNSAVRGKGKGTLKGRHQLAGTGRDATQARVREDGNDMILAVSKEQEVESGSKAEPDAGPPSLNNSDKEDEDGNTESQESHDDDHSVTRSTSDECGECR